MMNNSKNDFNPIEAAKLLLSQHNNSLDKNSINSAVLFATMLVIIYTRISKTTNKKDAIETSCDLIITYMNKMQANKLKDSNDK